MNDLVIMHNGKPMVSSELIAKKFGKSHKHVLESIRRLINECPMEFSRPNFRPSVFTNSRGREYDCYVMTRDGFSLLAMGFTGSDAIKWKIAFISAFNNMESKLLEKMTPDHEQARLQGKESRKQVTDTIKDFVEYSTKQGSKSASMYYSNITKMEYKALELIEKNQKVPKGFRDTLDVMDLSFLNTAEQVAKGSLKEGMDSGLHYKEIYILAKDRVMTYAKTVTFARITLEQEGE